MRRRDKAEWLVRLGVKVAFGAAVGGHAYARQRLREVRTRWLP